MNHHNKMNVLQILIGYIYTSCAIFWSNECILRQHMTQSPHAGHIISYIAHDRHMCSYPVGIHFFLSEPFSTVYSVNVSIKGFGETISKLLVIYAINTQILCDLYLIKCCQTCVNRSFDYFTLNYMLSFYHAYVCLSQ